MKKPYVLITGGTSGIGKELARHYVELGATVYITARSNESGIKAVADIKAAVLKAKVDYLVADFSKLSSVLALSEAINHADIPIDILIHNAGVHIPYRHVVTDDNHEMHHQVNYLAPFLLTHLLIDRIQKSPMRKLVYISSKAHHMASYPAAHRIPGLSDMLYRYSKSKELSTAFFLYLQRLYPSLNIYVISPGRVNTQVHRYHDFFTHHVSRIFTKSLSAKKSAQNIIKMIEAPEKKSYLLGAR